MSTIHRKSFSAGWPPAEMRLHIDKDLCLGLGDPLSAFILVQIGGDQADILTIATHPEHRRKGLAKQLLSQAETILREQEVQTLFLDVSELNDSAKSLYKACGYQAVGRRPRYYRTPAGRVASITFSKSL
ncbi:GNAT family N-acetyltransferase [Litorimonas haliclonae]|uniref:GNAT family N-acetyltransferase n=1 Tax=Litorimonas haliclonae TaxID=2081977 RepID=UPI0039EEEB29